MGTFLSQMQDDWEKVVSYYSKALNKHEQGYCTTRKELLAVVCALKHFYPYLYGQPVLLRTDNAAVNCMRNLKNPTGQVARWLQEFGTYNLKVVHRPGNKAQQCGCLVKKTMQCLQRHMWGICNTKPGSRDSMQTICKWVHLSIRYLFRFTLIKGTTASPRDHRAMEI